MKIKKKQLKKLVEEEVKRQLNEQVNIEDETIDDIIKTLNDIIPDRIYYIDGDNEVVINQSIQDVTFASGRLTIKTNNRDKINVPTNNIEGGGYDNYDSYNIVLNGNKYITFQD